MTNIYLLLNECINQLNHTICKNGKLICISLSYKFQTTINYKFSWSKYANLSKEDMFFLVLTFLKGYFYKVACFAY